jgi:hypothetical protein
MNCSIAFLQENSSVAIQCNPDFSSFPDEKRIAIETLIRRIDENLHEYYPEDVTTEKELYTYHSTPEFVRKGLPTGIFEVSVTILMLRVFQNRTILLYAIASNVNSNLISREDLLTLFPFPEEFCSVKSDCQNPPLKATREELQQYQAEVERCQKILSGRFENVITGLFPEVWLITDDDRKMISETIFNIVSSNIVIDEIEDRDSGRYIVFYSQIWNFKSLLEIVHKISLKLEDMKSGDFRHKSIENQNRIRKNFACYDLPIGDILDVVRAIYTMFSIDVFDLDNMLQYPLVDNAFLNARRRTIRTILDMYETHLSSAAEAYDLPMIARTYAEGRKMSRFRYQFTAFKVCLNVYNINDDFVQKCTIVWHYGRVVDVSDIMEYVLIYPVKYSRIAAYGNDGDEIFDALTDKLFEDFIPTMVGLVRKFC